MSPTMEFYDTGGKDTSRGVPDPPAILLLLFAVIITIWMWP